MPPRRTTCVTLSRVTHVVGAVSGVGGREAMARLNTSSAFAFASANATSSGALLSVMVMHMA